MSTAGITAAVNQAVIDVIDEMNTSGAYPTDDVTSPQLQTLIEAVTRAVLERLEAQATAGGDPITINT